VDFAAVFLRAVTTAGIGLKGNDDLMNQGFVELAAKNRVGCGDRAQKDRSEVHHSTKKPWRQKGTGRARAGMTSSPLWRGGGKIFPNSPDENFTQKVNKKMYRAGMRSILSQLARDGRLSVIEPMTLEAPKTKLLAAKMKAMGLGSVLVISDGIDENLLLASRNLTSVLIVEPRQADPVSLVHFDSILITRPALAKFEEILA